MAHALRLVAALRISPLVVFLTAALGCAGGRAITQDAPPEPPRRDAKKGDFLAFPLGPLGGRGEVLADRREITVLAVTAAGPAAAAGLRTGDQVLAIGGKDLPVHSRDINVLDGPMRALGDAIDAAERTGDPLRLGVLRGGARMQLFVELPETGGLDPTDLGAGSTARLFQDAICADLLRTRRKNGSWAARTGEDASRYVTALCGLALLGRGELSDLPALRQVAEYLAGPERRGYCSEDMLQPAGLSNWFLTMSGIYLSEYVLATGEREFVPTIQHLSDCMVARQSAEGRYGHGIHTGYRGKGFNVINTHAHLMWALAERAGCRIDGDAWGRSLAEIVRSTGDNGGVRYWTLQTGYWDACARTGQMALALGLRDEQPALRRRMAAYLAKHSARMREAHATGSIGMIFGTAALRRLAPDEWRAHLERWRWYLNLMRQPDGAAAYVGGKRNNGGDSYLRYEHVANAIAGMIFASALGKLHMCGNDARGWLVN